MTPFNAVRSPAGDIVVFYVGAEPRLTAEQALAFADQLRALAAEPGPTPAGAPGHRRHAAA
ncbi:hypothetical protein [Nonomuraea diastatica]|uniref:Uncharacterized protein n=1 Tax=Nonomuraea diastatica TaxID=1848329 RepID=A0A4R4X1M5_9ACTN|nr:hypothetical protein [Nonomuraea diastatica]TDD24052.1 hypothetical protein E1294_07340 [Nonomuraea diastatica]